MFDDEGLIPRVEGGIGRLEGIICVRRSVGKGVRDENLSGGGGF